LVKYDNYLPNLQTNTSKSYDINKDDLIRQARTTARIKVLNGLKNSPVQLIEFNNDYLQNKETLWQVFNINFAKELEQFTSGRQKPVHKSTKIGNKEMTKLVDKNLFKEYCCLPYDTKDSYEVKLSKVIKVKLPAQEKADMIDFLVRNRNRACVNPDVL